MNLTLIDHMMASVKRELREADKTRLTLYETEDRLERVTTERDELAARCEEQAQEIDAVSHENSILADENETLRDAVECGGYFEQRLFQSRIEQENDELREANAQKDHDIDQLKQHVKQLQETLAFRNREREEYRRIYGPIEC
jgi:hypothetical protein